MFRNFYPEALSRLVSLVGAVVLASTFIGAAIGAAEVPAAAATASHLSCIPVLA